MKRLTVVAFALAACTSAVEPAPTLAGTYDLVSLNGGGLPAVVASIPPEVLQVTRETITLHPDGTFARENHWRVVTGPPVESVKDDSITHAGRYLRVDRLVILAGKDTLTFQGDGVLTQFYKRSELGGPYRDVTYRYLKR